MGHLVGKEIYQKLGDKIDSLPFRVNKNKALFNILKELYTSQEAELVVNIPHVLSSADQIEKATRIEKSKLNALLESLCTIVSQKIMKGLIGGFLKLSPVKKALMSEKLRSSFLYLMKKGAAKQNKEYLLEI